MKNSIKITLFVVLVVGVFSQQLIGTSDESVQIYRDDDSGPRLLQNGTIQIFGGSFGGGGGRPNVTIITKPNGTRSDDDDNNTKPSNPKPQGKAVFASFGEPNSEARAVAQSSESSFGLRQETNRAAQNSLRSARWICPGQRPWNKVVFLTPCFYNPCPKGKITIYIRATCKFTVYLVDEFGNYVSTIGSGNAWWTHAFDFYTDCGKYRIKIVLKCTCSCAYVQYNIVQDQEGCFECQNNIMYTYNPQTCECECASSCQDCKKPQRWYEYPQCTCGCPKSLICNQGQYFDRRQCRCKCIPRWCCHYQIFGVPCKNSCG